MENPYTLPLSEIYPPEKIGEIKRNHQLFTDRTKQRTFYQSPDTLWGEHKITLEASSHVEETLGSYELVGELLGSMGLTNRLTVAVFSELSEKWKKQGLKDLLILGSDDLEETKEEMIWFCCTNLSLVDKLIHTIETLDSLDEGGKDTFQGVLREAKRYATSRKYGIKEEGQLNTERAEELSGRTREVLHKFGLSFAKLLSNHYFDSLTESLIKKSLDHEEWHLLQELRYLTSSTGRKLDLEYLLPNSEFSLQGDTNYIAALKEHQKERILTEAQSGIVPFIPRMEAKIDSTSTTLLFRNFCHIPLFLTYERDKPLFEELIDNFIDTGIAITKRSSAHMISDIMTLSERPYFLKEIQEIKNPLDFKLKLAEDTLTGLELLLENPDEFINSKRKFVLQVDSQIAGQVEKVSKATFDISLQRGNKVRTVREWLESGEVYEAHGRFTTESPPKVFGV